MNFNARVIVVCVWLLVACGEGVSPASAQVAEKRRPVVVGVVNYGNAEESRALGAALTRELKARQERPNVSYNVSILNIEFNDAAGADAIRSLKSMHADIVFLTSPWLIDKVLEAIDNVPIVITGQAFLWKLQFFQTLSRPGGRVTGFIRDPSSFAKSVDLLQTFCPAVRRVGVVVNADLSADGEFVDYIAHENESLRSRGSVIIPLYSNGLDWLASLPKLIRDNRLDALNIGGSSEVRRRFGELASVLQTVGIPHIYSSVSMVELGGGFAAQPARFDVARTGAEYISRIAHGTSPGEIPVQINRAYDIAVHTEHIRDFKGCDPRRIAKIANLFYP
jgi:ABC-type uncharacterized transport system substrate-binding protein